jgi:hypothetical protein
MTMPFPQTGVPAVVPGNSPNVQLTNPMLQYGSYGSNVAWLKDVLTSWGYYDPNHYDAAVARDVYGWDAWDAIASLQRDFGLVANGLTSAETWSLIDRLASGAPVKRANGTWANLPAGQQPPGTPVTPPPPPGPGTPPPMAGGTRDALARMTTLLSQYGLGNMAAWAETQLRNGATESEVMLSLYEQPEFKARFPAAYQNQTSGYLPLNPAQIIEYEKTARELFKQAGLNPSMYTPQELQSFIVNNVSLNELQSRLTNGLNKVAQAPAEVRMAFGQYFGTNSNSAMAQLFLDPTKSLPELEKMAQTAFVGGIGKRFGVNLAQQMAREIADTGVSDAAVWQGFAQINEMRPVFDETISEQVDMTAERQGVGSVFNTDVNARAEIENRVRSRSSMLSGGGGVASTEQGIVGLGVAGS